MMANQSKVGEYLRMAESAVILYVYPLIIMKSPALNVPLDVNASVCVLAAGAPLRVAAVAVPCIDVNQDRLELVITMVSDNCLSLLSIAWIIARTCG